MVRRIVTLVALVALVCLIASPADAGGGRRKEKREDGKEGRRARLIKKFDRDGDGKLNREEKAALRKFLEEKKEKRGERRASR